ncbi:MAG: ABC transporter permease subunit [Chloroflexia bacterium]|nr:ABC transporter permease subunit [Chloroflexia bacterium]
MASSAISLDQPRTMRASTSPAIVRAVRSELARLTRRTFLGTETLIVAALTLLATIATFYGAANASGEDGFGPAMMGAVLEAPGGIVVTVQGAATLLGIVVLAFAATAVAVDYSTGFIRLLVQAEPRRWRLIAGKAMALAGLTVGAAALATLVGVAASFVMAGLTGVSTAAWTSDLLGTVGATFVNLSLGLMVWGAIGFAIAVITRSTAAAIAGGIGYVLVIENLLGLLNQDLAQWLPGSAITALVAGGNATLGYGTALGLAAGYTLLGLIVSLAVFQRRDITA